MTEGNRITSGRLLARNTVLNLVGQVAPMLVAIVTIPVLIRHLGTERFGVLTLVWMVIGYFSLFDLGLSRALTQVVSEKLGRGEEEEIPLLVWNGLACMLLLGVAGTLGLAASTDALVLRVLNVPPELQAETIRGATLLAFSLPVVITTAGLRGVLEAKQRFDLVNAIRVPMGVFTFLGPLAVLPFSTNLVPVVAVSIFGRVVVWVAHLVVCLRVMPSLRTGMIISPRVLRPLLSYGGWMTVSNLISPVMVYLDRFLIGAVLTVAAVAYYVTPYEMITKLWIVPGALVGVLFPAFAAAFAYDRGRAERLFERGNKMVFVSLFPITLAVVVFAREALHLWLKDPEFTLHAAGVLQWLAAGVFINSLAHLSFSVVQGAGRSDLTAKLHLGELPVYLVVLWLLVGEFGVVGAAVAWTARATVDSLVLVVMVERCLGSGWSLVRREAGRIAAAAGVLGVGAIPMSLGAKTVFLSVVLAVFFWIGWRRLLGPEERALLTARFHPAAAPSVTRP